MQVEQKRACTSCGSVNAPDAGFCWRCLVPFADVPTPPGVRSPRPGALPPAPVAWSPPGGEPSSDARSSKVAGAIVALVAAVAAYVGVQYVTVPACRCPTRSRGRSG